MPNKAAKSRKTVTVKNLTPEAMRAVKAFKGLKAARTPEKLKGKNAAAIKRAVRDFYLG